MNGIKVGFIVDPLDSLCPAKDTSIALMIEVANIGGRVFTADFNDLVVKDRVVYGIMNEIRIHEDRKWYSIIRTTEVELSALDHLWLRKNPPFDCNYLYATQLLDLVIKNGGKVFNNPAAVRKFNEKLLILNLSCIPESIVSSNQDIILEFLAKNDSIVIKSLDSFGGRGVLFLQQEDVNKETIISMMTKNHSIPIMAQKYIPEIVNGDKRILIFGGKPYSKSLARIPKPGDLRGNIDAGASVIDLELSDTDLSICEEIIPILEQYGIAFAGIDVIGDVCTEINITSPTCVRELEKLTGENITSKILSSVL